MSDGIISGHQPANLELGNIIIKQISKSCQAKFTPHLSYTIKPSILKYDLMHLL